MLTADTNHDTLTANGHTDRGIAVPSEDTTTPVAAGAAFGVDVFGDAQWEQRLSPASCQAMRDIVRVGRSPDADLADEVAGAMKAWAVENGATHYCHWFQPWTGGTAEKHEALTITDDQTRDLVRFSGAELQQGEPDASSFPSGGLRGTAKARGYTIWDPSSPAFLSRVGGTVTLCIPSVFVSWAGEALDQKTPLLRSRRAVSDQAMRILRLFGNHEGVSGVTATIGPEQEYFLVDEKLYRERPDLLLCGRTLFGLEPPRHQQLDDHYFGRIPARVRAFMADLESCLWRLGVPVTTRHNEVAPGQYEIAPRFGEAAVSGDRQMLIMEWLDHTARRHGFRALLHEKPFAGINGSGKHINWSLCTDTGVNLLDPGDKPHVHLQFLVFLVAVIAAVDEHAELLRASIASAGNDHRLGANEAPPAIMSVFLGSMLADLVDQLESGVLSRTLHEGEVEMQFDGLPSVARDAGDRNRTSPFAFTGNKFEFRAVGSSATCAWPTTVINTIVAASLEHLADSIERRVTPEMTRRELEAVVLTVLQVTVRRHRPVMFEGDNYDKSWHDEARQRGLPNRSDTAASLSILGDVATKLLFSEFAVLSPAELAGRAHVLAEQYVTRLRIEAETMVSMARTIIAPAGCDEQGRLAQIVASTKAAGMDATAREDALRELITLNDVFEKQSAEVAAIERSIVDESPFKSANRCSEQLRPAMDRLRGLGDRLESIVPAAAWPLPSTTDMLIDH